MPMAHVSRAFFEPTLEGGPIGDGYVGVPAGHIDERRTATAADFRE